MTHHSNVSANLNDLTVLRIQGPDAVEFLHSQLSNDIAGLGPTEARLAAYCNPKGRMLGSLVLWRETADSGESILALIKADLAETLIKRLRMFVLRSKVKIDFTNLHVHGESVAAPASVLAPWQVKREAGATRISAPSFVDGPARSWMISTNDQPVDTAVGSGGSDDTSLWHAQDILAGLGWVELANVELFIPQSLNYDLSGGVSFTKGCYPGQEIVARTHFRGVVKRRAVPGIALVPQEFQLQAGADIFDAKRPGSPAGRIINAAAIATPGEPGLTWHILMEVSLADLGEADFRVLSVDGPIVKRVALPYPLAPNSAD